MKLFTKTIDKHYSLGRERARSILTPTTNKKTSGIRQRLFLIRREDKIRTCDPLHPMQVRYRAAPLPELKGCKNKPKILTAKSNPEHYLRTIPFA
jgi:hypothetical protein